MPELPEVEVVRRGLARHVAGRRVGDVEVLHLRPLRRSPGGPEAFRSAVSARVITSVRRRGKYLWLALDSDDAVLAHLGMSGQMLVQPRGAPDERHLRVRFSLETAVDDGPGQDAGELRFVDQRMFGGLSLSPGGAGLPAEMAHIARDPLDPEFDDAAFVRRVRSSASSIKRLLLTQTVVSGVGNIYADESLWLAGVHGDRPGRRLTRAQVLAVLDGTRRVMAAALEQGGTSFDALYVNVNGESGYFDRSLEVYGQEGLPCGRCGTPVVRTRFMNRSSYWCPRCQPRPRATRG